jgi:WD40 repeat protein/transcriptional regulator with XRE-family HTH domain
MARASRSWKVRDDCLEIVKNITIQKYGRQEDLAEQVRVSRSTVSKYLNGRLVDIAQFKEISFFLGFNDGKELACLPNGNPLLECTLIGQTVRTPIAPPALSPEESAIQRQNWGKTEHGDTFYGRLAEIEILEKWILRDQCRAIAVLGMGGIGKTTLAQKFVEHVQDRFEFVIWRSLRQAPPLAETLAAILKSILPSASLTLPDTTSEKISYLVEQFQTLRCLIILDNMESILAGSDLKEESTPRGGYYRAGYEAYGELIQQMGEGLHQSCLVLTSREKPKEISALEGQDAPVRSLILRGLDPSAAQHILQTKKLMGTPDDLDRLIQIYAGNPLALKIVASNIQEVFAGNTVEFLSIGTVFFGYIGELLDAQFNRLSALEQEIMFWLAINQEAISLTELSEDFATFTSKRDLLEALESLGRRSLIEKYNNLFGQQPVVMEYTTERLIAQVCKEIVTAKPSLLKSHALLKARAKDYIRESQIRLILEPIINQLKAHFKTTHYIENQCQKKFLDLQQSSPSSLGYTAGNLINLLCQLKIDLTGYDFSSLMVWQAYLCNVNLHRVNFSHADLSGTIFKETFGGILSLDLSSDGKFLVTAGTDGAVRLWQVLDEKLLWVGKGHNNWVFSITFSPDGTKLVSGSPDSTVRIWDIATGEQLTVLRNIGDEINTIDISPSGCLAIGGSGQDIALVDANTGKPLRILQGHSGSRILAVAFSPDGQTVLTGSIDNTLKLWDVLTGNCLQTFLGHTDGVRSVAYHPDGKMIASGSIDRTVKLWDISSGKCWQTLAEHQAMILALAFSPDGSILTSASMDRTLRLWEVNSGHCLRILSGHHKPVWSLAYSPDGTTIVSGGDDHAVKFWDTATGQCIKTWQGNSNAMTSVACPTKVATESALTQRLKGPPPHTLNRSFVKAKPAYLLASGSEDHNIRLWDIHTQKCCRTLRGHKGRVVSLQYSPDGQTLFSGSWDGTAKLWDVSTGECLETFYGHALLIWSVAFSSDGHTLATGSDDGTIRLWNARGQCQNILSGHQSAVHTVAFSPNAQTLASGGIDGVLRLWNVSGSEDEPTQTLAGQTSPIRTIIFSANGCNLISAGKDPAIKVWNLDTGRCEKILEGHREAVWSVALSPDGCLLASGGEDRTIKLWDLESGQCLQTLTGHLSMIVSVAFEPEASLLVSGSLDETLNVWDIQTGECLRTLHVERPYEEMNITGVTGITEAQKETLKTLGAIES